jgi:hypothetical protein
MEFNFMNKPEEDMIRMSTEELEQLCANEQYTSQFSPEVLSAIKTELALRGWE